MTSVANRPRAEALPVPHTARRAVPPNPLAASRRSDIEKIVVVLTLVALGMRQIVHSGATSGYIIAILLVPVWAGVIRHYRGGRVFVTLGLAAVVAGYVLSKLAYDSGYQISPSNRTSSSVLLLGTICGVGVILWARRILALHTVALWYGVGMLLGAMINPGSNAGNPWKFVWGIPVAVVVLALASRARKPAVPIMALLLLALVSVVSDSRSYFATFLLAAIVLLWQSRPGTKASGGWWVRTALLMIGIAVTVYYLGTFLLVNGVLGKAAQARSLAQINSAGSLILGGRPELAATTALMRHRPWGFGVGVIPNSVDVLVAKTGMASINYDPNNGYVDKFMFGGHIELHSNLGDMWANWGLVGVVLVLVIAFLVIRGVASTIANRTADAGVVFLGFWTLWNLLFSPLFAAEPTLMLTMGLVMLGRPTSAAGSAPAQRAPRPDREGTFPSRAGSEPRQATRL